MDQFFMLEEIFQSENWRTNTYNCNALLCSRPFVIEIYI